MTRQELISRYEKMVANIRWHIKTNKPVGEDLQVCEKDISRMSDFIGELKSIDESPSPSITAKEFLEKQGYAETVHPPGQEPFSPTFQWSTVLQLLEEYRSQVPADQDGLWEDEANKFNPLNISNELKSKYTILLKPIKNNDMLSTEQLMKPRYKVIADWPGSRFRIGQILKQDFTTAFRNDNGIGNYNVDKYPNLFKELHWWEERDEKDMPEYIKFVDDYMDFKSGAVYKCEKWSEHDDMIEFRTGVGKYDLHGVPPSFNQLLPATLSEYTAYSNQ